MLNAVPKGMGVMATWLARIDHRPRSAASWSWSQLFWAAPSIVLAGLVRVPQSTATSLLHTWSDRYWRPSSTKKSTSDPHGTER